MKQIRDGIFETNSSSSHSISIRKTQDHFTNKEIADSFYQCSNENWNGELDIWDMDLEFGRSPFNVLISFKEKLYYAIASLAYDPDKRTEIESVMYEFIPGLREICYLRDYESDKTYYGYVDHQSIGLLQSFLEKHNISIREFLLSKKYIVFIDGDEYQITDKLFDNNLIHKKDFSEVGYEADSQ